MRMFLSTVLFLSTFAAVPASAQSFNLRGGQWPVPLPSSSYGAATGQAGTWCEIPHHLVSAAAGPLVDISGSATPVTAFTTGCDFDFCNVGYGPDVTGLLGVFLNGDCHADASQTRIFNLQPGHYEATLYGTPCIPTSHVVHAYPPGVVSPVIIPLGGSYNGSFAQMQLGQFGFDVPTPGTLRIVTGSYGGWAALQLTHFECPSTYCTAKLNSQGCTPTVSSTGTPSASATSGFVVQCANAINQKPGLLLYKIGGSAANLPFQGGT